MEQVDIHNLTDEQVLMLLDAKAAGRPFDETLRALHIGELSIEQVGMAKELWALSGELSLMNPASAPDSALLARILREEPVHAPSSLHEEGVPSPYARFVLLAQNWKVAAPVLAVFLLMLTLLGPRVSISPLQPTVDLAVETPGNKPGAQAKMAMRTSLHADEGGEAESPTAPVEGVAPMMRMAMVTSTEAVSDEDPSQEIVAMLTANADGEVADAESSDTDSTAMDGDNAAVDQFKTYDETYL